MIRLVILVLVWFGCLFASLLVERIDMGHAVCGSWGCGPPTSALLSVHLFWFIAILPPVLYFSVRIPLPWKTIGTVIAIASAVCLAGFGIFDYFGENRPYYDAGFVWQRYLLSLATFGVDFPVVQTLFSGLAAIMFGHQCQCCAKPNEPQSAQSLSEVP